MIRRDNLQKKSAFYLPLMRYLAEIAGLVFATVIIQKGHLLPEIYSFSFNYFLF